jgi:hypothetical protein
MKYLAQILALVLMALGLNACGGSGGGGGGSSTGNTITGAVVYVETGGAPNPQASVQVGSASVLTDSSDGSFTLNVPAGTTTVTVDTKSSAGVWTFTIPAVSGTEDVGNLWVGPQKVTLTGQVLDSSTNAPIAGATVNFGGAVGTTNASGTYSLNPVAYPNTNFAAFWGILGNVTDPNYFANTLSASPNTAVGGVVTVAPVLMTPLSNTTPPNTPYTIWGRITPLTLGAGCTAILMQNGTPVRQTTADGTGTYYFWVPAGTYTIHFVNGPHTDATDPTVTVKATNDVERQDVVLN